MRKASIVREKLQEVHTWVGHQALPKQLKGAIKAYYADVSTWHCIKDPGLGRFGGCTALAEAAASCIQTLRAFSGLHGLAPGCQEFAAAALKRAIKAYHADHADVCSLRQEGVGSALVLALLIFLMPQWWTAEGGWPEGWICVAVTVRCVPAAAAGDGTWAWQVLAGMHT